MNKLMEKHAVKIFLSAGVFVVAFVFGQIAIVPAFYSDRVTEFNQHAQGAVLTVFPGTVWATKTPQELGLNQAKLDQFAKNVGGTGIIIKDGYIVKKWGKETSKGDWASAVKPVTSTLLFFAVNEGRISGVDALIKDWGWALSEKDQSMTFRHLANMTGGYARGEAPGAAWAYNDYAIKLYSLTMQKVFGQTLDQAAQQRFAPLQLQDGSLYGSRSGLGISTTPRDFARIGWLWLNKGNWNGNQLLPASYFDNYMMPQVPSNLPRTQIAGSDYLNIGTHGGGSDQTPYGPGFYGFNWWFNTGNSFWPDAPADTFQANGHWGKEVMTIIPSLNMVVAARGSWGSFEPGNAASGMNQNLKLLKEAVTGGSPIPSSTPTPTTAGYPDYIAEGLVFSPNPVVSGQLLSFSAVIKNIGAPASVSAKVRLRIDKGNNGGWDISTSNQTISPLGTNALETEIWTNVWAAVAGTHRFEVCADSSALIKESVETNNCSFLIFTVSQ